MSRTPKAPVPFSRALAGAQPASAPVAPRTAASPAPAPAAGRDTVTLSTAATSAPAVAAATTPRATATAASASKASAAAATSFAALPSPDFESGATGLRFRRVGGSPELYPAGSGVMYFWRAGQSSPQAVSIDAMSPAELRQRIQWVQSQEDYLDPAGQVRQRAALRPTIVDDLGTRFQLDLSSTALVADRPPAPGWMMDAAGRQEWANLFDGYRWERGALVRYQEFTQADGTWRAPSWDAPPPSYG